MKNKIILLVSVSLVSISFNALHASNEEEPAARVVAASSFTTPLKSCLRVGPRIIPKKQVSTSEILDAPEEKVLSQVYRQIQMGTAQSKREKDALLSPDIIDAKKSILKMKNIAFKQGVGTELSAEEKIFLLTYCGPGSSNRSPVRKSFHTDRAMEKMPQSSPSARRTLSPMAAIIEADEESSPSPSVRRPFKPMAPIMEADEESSPSPSARRTFSPMAIIEEETSDFSATDDNGSVAEDQGVVSDAMPAKVRLSK